VYIYWTIPSGIGKLISPFSKDFNINHFNTKQDKKVYIANVQSPTQNGSTELLLEI